MGRAQDEPLATKGEQGLAGGSGTLAGAVAAAVACRVSLGTQGHRAPWAQTRFGEHCLWVWEAWKCSPELTQPSPFCSSASHTGQDPFLCLTLQQGLSFELCAPRLFREGGKRRKLFTSWCLHFEVEVAWFFLLLPLPSSLSKSLVGNSPAVFPSITAILLLPSPSPNPQIFFNVGLLGYELFVYLLPAKVGFTCFSISAC